MDVGSSKYAMAEFLAHYTDKVLKKGGMKVEKQQYEEHLEQIITLFTFLVDKDLYLMVFKNQLARRLLQEKFEDFEYEKLFITNLKITCGMQQMNHLQGMLQDYGLVREEQKEFTDFIVAK